MNRREFLGVSSVGCGALIACPSSLATPMASQSTVAVAPSVPGIRLSLQEWLIPRKGLEAKVEWLVKHGITGIEVGGRNLAKRVDELRNALDGSGVTVSAVCAGFKGWLIAEDPVTRKTCIDSMKTILAAAGEVGSSGLIWVPAFNRQKSLSHKEARKILTGFRQWKKPVPSQLDENGAPLLLQLGQYAQQHGTRMLIEPLNRDETYFVRTLADGASICRDLEHPGVGMMADFWHMTWEETSDFGAIHSAAPYLHHVHIASRTARKVPGEDGSADCYRDGFRALKQIGYKGHVSFECRDKDNAEDVLRRAFDLLRTQWDEA